MAHAPTPGTGRRKQDAEAVTQIMTMTVRGEKRRIAVANIPVKERLLVRKATGLPLEAFLKDDTALGEDSLIVLWWLAGRAEGNAFLTFDQAIESWPETLAEDDIDVHVGPAQESEAADHPE